MKKNALITGITGQDGAYLAKFLLEKNYEVIGAYRRNSMLNNQRFTDIGVNSAIPMVELEMLEFSNILHVIKQTKPTEIYNLAAQSFVAGSFEQPIYTSDVNALGTARLLEAIRTLNPEIRFYQASSSEMFGKVKQSPQNENTPFYPRSPYGVSKLYAHWLTVNYREAHNIHASSGILFNHESPLRGREFVTRKITSSLALIKHGKQNTLELGNLEAKRDWGFAGDYVKGMWQMLQAEKADDYVLATGITHSVREFAEKAASLCGFDLEWTGNGADEKAIDKKTGKVIIAINPAYLRKAEVDILSGDAAKARNKLGWKNEISFEKIVELMMKADLERAAKGLLN